MQKSELNQRTRQELETLANSLIMAGIKTNDPEILLIGNGLLTLLSATSEEESRIEITRVLMQFCVRQVEKNSGMSEADIQMQELLRDSEIGRAHV